jgi:hypothetical protein
VGVELLVAVGVHVGGLVFVAVAVAVAVDVGVSVAVDVAVDVAVLVAVDVRVLVAVAVAVAGGVPIQYLMVSRGLCFGPAYSAEKTSASPNTSGLSCPNTMPLFS